MSVLAHEPMLMMLVSLSQAVGSQTALPLVNPPTSRITPLWGKGDPPISVTGVFVTQAAHKDTSWGEHVAAHIFPRES